MECMDDAPAMRGMFFVILIPFVLWFLSLLPLLILHLVVVVYFFDYTPPPDTFISSLLADSEASKRAFIVDIQSA